MLNEKKCAQHMAVAKQVTRYTYRKSNAWFDA